MRIVAGRLRGRSLVAPADARVRPTSDRVREALFNILAHQDFGRDFSLEGARVLDLFAGTGALGIEALSRGARFALFVEDDAEARGLVRQNIETLGLTGITKVWRRDASRLEARPAQAGEPFDLVFADPPYRKNLLGPCLTALRAGDWIAPCALVVAELAADEIDPPTDGYHRLEDRRWGETRVLVLAADNQ